MDHTKPDSDGFIRHNDDRTEEQKSTHTNLIVMEDSFMSGWGRCEHGKSYAAWAYEDHNVDTVVDWVSSRSDCKRWWDDCLGGSTVFCEENGEPLKDHDAFHIYVISDGHPATKVEL